MYWVLMSFVSCYMGLFEIEFHVYTAVFVLALSTIYIMASSAV